MKYYNFVKSLLIKKSILKKNKISDNILEIKLQKKG